MYIKRCSFCNKNTPETIEHMLIECFRWNSIRHETTIFNIPRLYRTVTIDQSTNNQALNQGRNIMVGKLLGGESKETRSLLAQSRDRYSPYMKELETGRFMNGIRVVRTLILDRIKIIKDDSESQTAISGLGRRVRQLDAGQTENAEYQDTKPDQSPHPTATRLVLFSSSSKGSLHRRNSL
ncbi:hypothetical protein BB560_003337 [Smittium megazygosporum]|uniref:Uncharacterized protein n=1 Tax=Smittium megazygosporum TaxID=133381 RepID=A0A2T9ZC83_9FUNG|nr:hypothetical protein BB560_003337 [Smittium megazygosporum]